MGKRAVGLVLLLGLLAASPAAGAACSPDRIEFQTEAGYELHGFGIVLWNAFAVVIHDAQVVLCLGIFLVSGFALTLAGAVWVGYQAYTQHSRAVFDLNLTASRVSLEKVRKFRMFLPGAYFSGDCAARKGSLYRLRETRGETVAKALGRPELATGG